MRRHPLGRPHDGVAQGLSASAGTSSSDGGARGGTGRLGHTTGSVRVRSVTICIPDPKGAYLVIEKGTLNKNYTVSGCGSWRFTFATQVFAQYKIPLYSRIMARLVLLPHSEHT